MKKMKQRQFVLLAVLTVIALGLAGCGQRMDGDSSRTQTETTKQTDRPTITVVTEKSTENAASAKKETEKDAAAANAAKNTKATEQQSETHKLITSVDYTSKDGSVKITLPDNTWKVTQDADEMRVFKSEEDAIINIVHATSENAMKGLTVSRSRQALEDTLTRQYSDESAYSIVSYAEGAYEDVNTYRYVVQYNAATRMWAYSVTYAVMTGTQAYVVTGTVTQENRQLLESVCKSVDSFRILNDDQLKTVTSEVVSGVTRTAQEENVDAASRQELQSLQEYANAIVLYTNDNVNMRMAPGTEAEILDELPADYEVEVTGETAGWYRVNEDGQTGYIRKDFLSQSMGETTAQPATDAALNLSEETAAELSTASEYAVSTVLYATIDANVRTAPGTDADIISSIISGNGVTVIGETDNWYMVSLGGMNGYIRKDCLESGEDAGAMDLPTNQAGGTVPADQQGQNTTPSSETQAQTPDSNSQIETVSGIVQSATADTLVVLGTDGMTYTVYYAGALVSAQNGLYEGAYVDVQVDPYQSWEGYLYATGVSEY